MNEKLMKNLAEVNPEKAQTGSGAVGGEVDLATRKRRVAVAQVAILKLLARGIVQRLAQSASDGESRKNTQSS